MLIWLIPLIIILLLLFLTHPSLRYSKCRRWRGERFAHRGLHDGNQIIVENTLQSFTAARDAGFGMELDIQFSKDMEVVVFHDDNLSRLAGIDQNVRDLTLDELRAFPLADRDDAHIPTFREVLDTVGGKTPLLIELKTGKDNAILCSAAMSLLRDYPGEYIVESFNPLIVAWFRFHAPDIVRGQLVCPVKGYGKAVNAVVSWFLAGLLYNCVARPDFVAYDVSDPRFPAPHLQRALYRTPMAAWTVRDPDTAAQVRARGEISIFECDGR